MPRLLATEREIGDFRIWYPMLIDYPLGVGRSKVRRDSVESTFVLMAMLDRPVVMSLVLAGFSLMVFLPVTDLGFISADDPGYFSANSNVLAGLNWRNVEWAFTTHSMQSPYPLTWLSLMLDAGLYGRSAAGPHLTNLILHAVNTILVFWLFRRISNSHWPSVFAAALFAVHPQRVESVVWISERKGLLSALFVLLATLAYFKYTNAEPDPTAATTSKNRIKKAAWYLTSLLLFIAALLSKPNAVILPLLLLILDWWPLGRYRTPRPNAGLRVQVIAEKVPFLAFSLLSSIRQISVTEAAGSLTSLNALPLYTRACNAFLSYAFYLRKALWPTNLAFPYPFHPNASLTAVTLSVLAIASITLVSLCRQRRPWILVGWMWFLTSLLPVIGLVQWSWQAAADRFTYVPEIGLFLILCLSANEVFHRLSVFRPAMLVLCALPLVIISLLTRHQLLYWTNGEALARHALSVTTDNSQAYNLLGGSLYRAGKYDEAANAFSNALSIDPRFSGAQNNLGLALAAQGRFEEAIRHYDIALGLSPTYAEAMANAGQAFTAEGDLVEARSRYDKALQLDPNLLSAIYGSASIAQHDRDFQRAVSFFERALVHDPNNAVAHLRLAQALAELHNFARARDEAELAVHLNSRLEDAKQFLLSLDNIEPFAGRNR
jgi:tetratricopeptide (TPR) repeat protein